MAQKLTSLSLSQCGRDSDHCSVPDNCISNCDAKAECGRGAEIPGATCPLNVCCSAFGYCGVTSQFCQTGGNNACQSNCNQPSSSEPNTGKVRNLVIGSVFTYRSVFEILLNKVGTGKGGL